MSKVDGSIKSLIQGVSQQPAKSRLPGQCTSQDNMSSNPVDGLTRRPPTENIKFLFTALSTPKFYYLNQGGTEQFLVVILPTEVRVFDLDGVEKSVTEIGSAYDYLTGGQLAITTLDNDTFIANKETVCEMSSTFASFIDYGALVYILGGQYARTFKITVTWREAGTGTPLTITASYLTPDGSNHSDGAKVATDYIATQLETALTGTATHNFNTTFTITRVSDVIYINWDDARTDSFEVTIDDGMGASNIVAVNNKVPTVGKLPRYAPQGYIVTVTGDGAASQDDWYLAFSVTPDENGVTPAVGAGFGKAGIWVETVRSKTPYLLDKGTMPHVLKYDPDLGTFEFSEGDWVGRQVGDEDSNADPSFVGRTIEDLGYFQGRLVVLSGPAVIMSRTNRPFDFWIESATGPTDSDAIDIESTAEGVGNMLRAIPHNRDLVVFAEGAQFIVFGRNALTAQNASLVLTTTFQCNLDAKPVPAGRNIFFAYDYGNYTGIREFYTEGAQDINDSRPITQHVLKYIEGKVANMASTSNFDTLLVQAADPSILYSYEYIWIGDRKAQSSWSRWLFPNPVATFFFVGSEVYMVSEIDTEYNLEKLNLDTQDDDGLTYQVKLDRRVSVPNVNVALENILTTMPDIDDMLFIQGEGCPFPGMRVLVESYNAGTNIVTLADDMNGGTVIAGQKYRSRYMPTIPSVKDEDGVKVETARLTIAKFLINCRNTGTFDTTVSSVYREPVTMSHTGRRVGNPSTVVGEAAIVDEVFTVPFRDNIDNAELEVSTDSHLPLTMTTIGWIGQYAKRGKRITTGE